MKDAWQIIDNLSPTDALSILKLLAKDDEQLAQRVAEAAMDHLSGVDPEEVAAGLHEELNTLRVEEVWERAGPKSYGYVEPSEAADQMIEQVLEPYLDELAKYQELGLSIEARRLCRGLLAGLYLFEHESATEFKDWAPDAPIIFAEAVVDVWKSGSPSRADVAALKAFIRDELSGWGLRLV